MTSFLDRSPQTNRIGADTGIRLRLTDSIAVEEPTSYIDWYLNHDNVSRGPDYYRPPTMLNDQPDAIVFGDLAWGTLLEGRPSSTAAQQLLRARAIDISRVPSSPLGELSDYQCDAVVAGIRELAKLDGIRSALATKVLHPKRRASVPILDNQAIYGAFMTLGFVPGDAYKGYGTRQETKIKGALLKVRECLRDETNTRGWSVLENNYPDLKRVELFDMVWWALLHASERHLEGGVWRIAAAPE